VKELNAFRQRRDVRIEGSRLSLNELLRRARIEWHGVALHHPDWSDPSHSLAFTVRSLRSRFLLHGMLNAYWEPLTFELPPVPDARRQSWRRWIDTSLLPPDDIRPWEEAPSVSQATYVVPPRTSVFLVLPILPGPDQRRTTGKEE
jgi:glycogen operon protein